MGYLAKCLSNFGVFFFIQTLDCFPAYLFIHIFVYIYIFVYLYICISIHFCLYISCLPLYLFTYINIFVYIHKYICLHINIFVTWSKYFLSSPSLSCTKRPREVSEWSFLKLYIKKIHKLFFVHLFNNILIIKTPCTKGVKTLQRRPYLENWCEPYKAVECGGTFIFLGQTVFLHPPQAQEKIINGNRYIAVLSPCIL